MFTGIFYSMAAGILISVMSCTETSKDNTNQMKLKIYHYKVPCTGESARLCLLVSKGGSAPEFFYDDIAGFEYNWGYNCEILVDQIKSPNPPADASAVTYRFKKLLSKKESPATDSFTLRLNENGQTMVQNKNGDCSYFNDILIQLQGHSCDELAKAESAVFRHDHNAKELVLVRINR